MRRMSAPILSKRIVFIATAFAVSVLVLFVTTSTSTKKQHNAALFFSDALKKVGVVEQVHIDEKTYDVSSGIVRRNGNEVSENEALQALKLTYALTIARHSPFFGLAGTEVSSLESELTKLEQIMQKLVDAQKNAADAKAIETLYPIDFLHSVAVLERRRQEFLTRGTTAEAVRYDEQVATTIGEYARAISRFKVELTNIIESKRNADVRIVRLGGVTTTGHMLTIVTELEQAAMQIKNEYSRRTLCHNGSTEECTDEDLALPRLPDTQAPFSDGTLPPIIEEIESVMREASGRAESEHVYVAQQSACVADTEPPHYLRVDTGQDRDLTVPGVRYIGELFFLSTDTPNVPLYSYFRSRGMSYSMHNPIVYYACPESGSVIGTARAITEIATFAQAHPSVAPRERSELLREALREEMAVEYVRTALAELDTSTDEFKRLLELALMLTDKSAGLDLTIQHIAHVTETDLGLKTRGAPFEVNPRHWYITHSAFLSLFFAHNPLIGISTSPYIQDDRAAEEASARVLRYSELRTTVPHKKIVDDIRAFLTIERRI